MLNLSLICGRGAMSCEAGAALFFLHIMQWFVYSLITSCPATTQNLLNSIGNKWFVPAEWLFSSWYDLTINLVKGLSLGNINGNLASYGKNSAYFSQPLYLINPSLNWIFSRKTCKFTTFWNMASSLKSFIFLLEIFFLWWLDCVNLCICHFCWT